MATGYVLYNTKAGSKESFKRVEKLEGQRRNPIKFIDVCKISDYRVFLEGLEKDDYIIIAGGDGTLNRFVNDTDGIEFDNRVMYLPAGTGNDFATDVGNNGENGPFEITEYLKNLPCVTVKGRKYRFLNGVGYGIDGYCCQVGDELKKIPGKKVNYTAIAIKGLLFNYKPTKAIVTVDGKTYTYEKVWIAPAMNGRFYGGGMMPAPEQKRNSDKLSVMIFHGSGKLKTLMIFPSLFKGEHVKHRKHVEILTGREVSVEFDRPAPLQIDGETVLDVSFYSAAVPAIERAEAAGSVG